MTRLFRLDAVRNRRIVNKVKRDVNGVATTRKKSKGQTLTEFALALPLLALLLFGIIQYGFLFSAYMTLRHGMHVAARTASLPGGTTNSLRSVVCSAVNPMLDCARLGTPTLTSNTIAGVTSVTVQGSYGLPLIVKFVVPGAVGNTYTLTASATYRTN